MECDWESEWSVIGEVSGVDWGSEWSVIGEVSGV